jgi:hypothetical protein
VHIQCSNEKVVAVKKSTLCWLYRDETKKITSDRLRRFVSENAAKFCYSMPSTDAAYSVKDEIFLGEWVVFNNHLVGQVIGFRYLTGSKREKQYTLEYALIKPSENTKPKGLEVLCSFYEILNDVLKYVDFEGIEKNYVNINEYLFHISPPIINENELKISQSALDHIQNLI